MIKISVPNDDEAALHYFGEAMIKLAASVRGEGPVDVRVELITFKLDDEVLTRLQQATSDLMQAAPAMMRENDVDGSIEIHGKRKEVETDNTAQQVESLAEHFDDGPYNELATTDSTDTPWDERIHSASKALTADGKWRLRRKPKDMNEDEWELEIQSVRDELLGQKPDDNQRVIDEAVSKLDALYEHEPPVTPPGDDFHVDAGVVTEQQVADIPPPPPVPTKVLSEQAFDKVQQLINEPAQPTQALVDLMQSVPKAIRSDEPYTFAQVMTYLTERHGRISNAQVEQIIAEMGLKNIMDLNTQPEHTGPFIARVKALLGE